MQQFARIDLSAEGVPDATTLLNFRHLLETHDLCKGLFTAINADLTARGLLLREGTLVDATLIADDQDIGAFTSKDPIVKNGVGHYEHHPMLHLRAHGLQPPR